MTLALIAVLFGLTVVSSFIALFFMWVIVMGFKGAHDAGKLSHDMTVFGYFVEAVGLVVDVWCNLLASFIFLELPREFTVSQRLRRLVLTTGWRRALATWFAVTLINPFAVGGPHIVIPTA